MVPGRSSPASLTTRPLPVFKDRHLETSGSKVGQVNQQQRRSYDANFKIMVVNKAESSKHCQAAKKFGVTECNVRRWRAPKQRLKDANSQRKSYRGPQSGRFSEVDRRVLNTSEKTRFGRSRWKRSSWGAMTARANTAGQRTCVRDRETSEEIFGEF